MHVIKALFVSETWWGWPFKLLFTLLSLVTLPLGAFLWPLLVTHGLNVLTLRAGGEVASRFGVKDPSVASGTGSGFIIDKQNECVLVFDCNANVRELPFSRIDNWEWHWIDKGGRKEKNVIKFMTLDEAAPVVTVGEFSHAGAEHWHQRLGIALGRA